MMHRDTMLKFGRLILPSSLLGAHIKVSAYGVRQGGSSSTLNFGTPFLSRKLIELGS